MQILKKIGKVALDVLIIIVFVISVFLVIANIGVDREKGEQPNVFGYVINSVQSESMSGTFEKGAIVVGKIPTEDTVIEKDDIISFRQKVNGQQIINTHRVVAVETIGNTDFYTTQGDNREICPTTDEGTRSIGDVVAVYKFQIPFVGSFIDFLKKPLGFVLCLVLPMLAFIAWQVYKLVSIYLQMKKAEMEEAAKEAVSDDAKEAIIKEYLAKMQAQNAANAPNAETTAEAQSEEVKEESNAE